MELIRVVGNVLIGIMGTAIAFTSHKTPSEAFRFLLGCIFDTSKEVKNPSNNQK